MCSVIDAIKNRRSINFFDPQRQISDEMIDELLKTASLAPSSFNLQPWEVIVVKSPERKKALRGLAFNQAKVEEASFVVIVIADPHAIEDWIDRVLDDKVSGGYIQAEARESIRAMPFKLYGEADSETRRIFAVKNASLFAMNLMIVAQGMGIESHPMDGIDAEAIKKEFKIASHKLIPMIIAFGYLKPETKLLARSFRKSLKDFVSYE